LLSVNEFSARVISLRLFVESAAFPFIMEIANNGIYTAVKENPAIESGTVILDGEARHLARISP
jgi:hypothetical protein